MVRKRLLRTLGALLGLALVLVAIPIGKLGQESWPPWVIAISFFGFGLYVLYFAITGRSSFVQNKNDD